MRVDRREELEADAEGCDGPGLRGALELVAETRASLRVNVGEELALEALATGSRSARSALTRRGLLGSAGDVDRAEVRLEPVGLEGQEAARTARSPGRGSRPSPCCSSPSSAQRAASSSVCSRVWVM